MPFALGLAMLGLFFLTAGAGSCLQSRARRRERERWIRVGGWVVGYRVRGQTSYPIVRFVLPSGETIDAESEFGANVRLWAEGQVVALCYDPGQPRSVTVEHELGDAPAAFKEYGGLALAGLGLFLLFIASIAGVLILSGWRFPS